MMNNRNSSQNKKDSKTLVKKKSAKLPPSSSSSVAINHQISSIHRNIHSASSPDSGQKNQSSYRNIHNMSLDKQNDQSHQPYNQDPIDEFLNNSIHEYLLKKEYLNTLDCFKDELTYKPSTKITIDHNIQNILLDVIQIFIIVNC